MEVLPLIAVGTETNNNERRKKKIKKKRKKNCNAFFIATHRGKL